MNSRIVCNTGCIVGVAAVLLLGAAIAAPAIAARLRICQTQEQSYEQIKPSATTLEINAALFAAVDKRCLSLAGRLLADGASLKARDRFGAMPLSRAAKAGDVEIVDLLLEHGAEINARDLDGSTALYVAAEAGRHTVVETLIASGADVNLPGRSGLTPIAATAFIGDDPLMRLLLDKGADANAVDGTGKSAICYAAGRGFPAAVRRLLDNGVDVNRRYGNDLTVLMWAAGYTEEAGTADMDEIIKLLIERGARLDDRDNRGRTALMIAAAVGHAAAAELLISRGADTAARDKQGKSAGELTSNEELRARLATKQ
ncbi:MAG: ankyrin repeat domain-containing protein [Hyphomicrobium sp.]